MQILESTEREDRDDVGLVSPEVLLGNGRRLDGDASVVPADVGVLFPSDVCVAAGSFVGVGSASGADESNPIFAVAANFTAASSFVQ